MTTTATKLSTGSGRFVRIMLIEGIEHPIVECSEADAQTALDGTDWDGKSVYSGTFDVNNKHSGHPWEPFQPAGTATVTVLDDAFGILTHRTAGGAETVLTATLDRTEDDVSVLDTSAFPDSGEAHIGTECFVYAEANVAGTKFGSVTRGMYSPFGTSSGGRYTHDHRVEPVPYAPNLAPRVTQYPRSWAGRWVGIWLHTYDENGINSKDDALCLFAGRIVEVEDDPQTGGTIVRCEHALTMMKDATIGRDQMTATIADGVYLVEGMQFDMQDNDGSTNKTANPLVVKVGAVGVNQIDAGYYEHTDLFSAFNDWWASEKTAGRLSGSYTAGMATISGGEMRTKIDWFIPGSSSSAIFQVSMPAVVSAYLGFQDSGADTLGFAHFAVTGSGGGVATFIPPGAVAPLRFIIAPGSSLTLPGESPRIQLEGVGGVFQDQYDTLPAAFKPSIDSGLEWGVFLIDRILVLAAFVDNSDGTYEFSSLAPLSVWYASLSEQNGDALKALSRPLGDATPVNVRQVFMFEMDAATFLKQVMLSTGTAGFNDSTYDTAPDGTALGWPWELFGTAFNTSVDNLPGATKAIGVIIDKPTKLSELIGSDLVLRHAFPIWKSGGLRMTTWQTPTATLAVTTLTEGNKADPSGNKISPRSSTILSEQWAKRIVKIRYDRSIADNGDDFKSTINVEDRTAIDDAGDRGDVFTINARNSYSEFVGSGAGIEEIVPNAFIPPLTMFTRPVRTINRSIATTQWDLAPGDIISLTDNFARDPSTGRRKVVGRPAVVASVSTSLGGAAPDGSTNNMVGEVEVLVVDTNRIYAYCPSALVASYASSTKTLTLSAHEYSESSEDEDVDHFPASGAIRITEVDPADPSSALSYTRTISSKSGNDIVHDGVALGTDTGETAYSASKTYRVTFDTYSAVISGQQDKAFQADDADGLIEDVAQADMFGQVLSTVAATASSHTDLPEFHAAVDYGDGKAYDVGSLKGFARLVDNLIDHKTAIQNPVLVNEVMTNTDYTTGYKLVLLMPIYLSNGISTNAVNRYLKVAPIFRSSDGTKVSVKITLARGAPTAAGLNDISHTLPISSAEFETTSTDWVVPTPDQANVMIKGNRGWAWLSLECSYKAETVGIAHCHEGERVQT